MPDIKLLPKLSHPYMGHIKAKNTSLELKLRRLLVEMGYGGYRAHYGKLLGKPDIVFTKHKKREVIYLLLRKRKNYFVKKSESENLFPLHDINEPL